MLRIKSIFQIVLLALLQLFLSVVSAENFPKPVTLQADVTFWLRVYTEIDTRSGFIHDSRNLSVVYETLKIKGSPRANRKRIRNSKSKYKSILNRLAKGKRTNLSRDEQRVLSMWGENVSNQRLKSAASSIRFQRGQSNRFKQGLVRSGRWRAYINSTLKEFDMPLELSVLPHVESSFNPDAYSHVGAAGLWQFIRSTGKRYMQIDYLMDERMDPYASTVAAAKLLKHNYQITKSWPLALTAYNHGLASMRRAINKLGTRDIAIIARKYKSRTFGFASRNFYVAFLAALEVDKNYERYFGSLTLDQPNTYEIVKTDYFYDAKDLARYLKIEKSTLKQHNRSLLGGVWSGTKRIPKDFNLRVPEHLLTKSAAQLIANIPSQLRYKKQTIDQFHIVQRGDTISEVAQFYGFRVKDVLAMNALHKKDYIRAGQKLRLPVELGTQDKKQVAVKENKQIRIAKADNISENTRTIANQNTSIVDGINTSDQESKQTARIKKNVASLENNAIEQAEDLDISIVTAPKMDKNNHVILLSDPADYTVDEANTIEVQASETLGHYAEWLDIRASRLRQINDMKFGKPVIIGKRIKLDFSEISRDEFENRRFVYQKELQEAFFDQYRIDSTYQHVIKKNESLWVLALRKFKMPIWLLRQHNPDIDFHRIKPGVNITIPILIESKK